MSFCVVKLSGLTVERSNSQVKHKVKQITTAVKRRVDIERLSGTGRMVGYRELYEKVGAGDEGLVSSCETLINLIFKRGSLPCINTVVDLYNCVSVGHGVTIGAHDAAKIEGDLRVGVTTGQERFVPLGSDSAIAVRAGEYAYMDEKDILCRLDVRQGDKTKITAETTEAIVFANSNPRMSDDCLLKACLHVCEIVEGVLGAQAEVIEFQ